MYVDGCSDVIWSGVPSLSVDEEDQRLRQLYESHCGHGARGEDVSLLFPGPQGLPCSHMMGQYSTGE